MENDNNPVIDMEELKAAQEAAKTAKGAYTHTFDEPLMYDGEEITELTFDFDRVTGRDCLAIEAELTAMGKITASPTFSGEYQIRFAAKACIERIGVDIFDRMKARDFLRITGKTRNFMLRADL